MSLVWLIALVCPGAFPVAAQAPPEPLPDKSRYSLFNPTPRQLLRELATDRPDQTESPYTVDAGHFQLEMDFVSFAKTRDRSEGINTELKEWTVAPVNLKVGLLNRVDLQLILETYLQARAEDRVAHTATTASGFGAAITRLKINLWGDDSGKSAFAVLPFIKWPLPESDLRNGKTEGGILFPLAVALPGGWNMGAMTGFDVAYDVDQATYQTGYINSITFGHTLLGKLSGYSEFFSDIRSESSWIGTVDFGLTYMLTDNIQLDGGCNIGVTGMAEDYRVFSGMSLRF